MMVVLLSTLIKYFYHSPRVPSDNFSELAVAHEEAIN